MNTLNKTTADRIARLFRLLSSEHDGEALNAVRAMGRLLATERLSFHDIACVIESCDGQIEEKKYSDTDAEIIFARGVEKGRVERDAPPEFYDVDGAPRWLEIALFCQKNIEHLRSAWERTFINDMAGKLLLREPSEKQAKHLLAIFIKLGGRYDPKAGHSRR